jgi:glutamate N-acetyltransferase/amino-acid N-acetyltransferase
MTTDTVAKESAVELPLNGGTVRMGAIAKGSGMVSPNMATMICLVTTDAAIHAEPLHALLRHAAHRSFNCISIDNDMSTSDTVLVLANGRSKNEIHPGEKDYRIFCDALTDFCQEMAKRLVRDAEGGTKCVEIFVEGAANEDGARRIARAIGNSQLCKTAFFGNDPNWGRFLCAAGYAGVDFDPTDINLWLDHVQLVRDGQVANYREEDAGAVMKQKEFRVRLSVGRGTGHAVYWASDLSYDYVRINAEYRT